ncbi:MAG: choice-of-anchor B domain-containing protein [Rhodothermales bacterium]
MSRLFVLFVLLLAAGSAQGQIQDAKSLDSPSGALASGTAAKSGAVTCQNGFADLYPCENVDLIAFFSLDDLQAGQYRANDLWGWEDPQTGRRYVLLGLENATAFVDITEPATPVLVGRLPLTQGARASVWRDIKVYADHAFVVADGAGPHGMQVFDLAQLRGLTGSPPVEFAELTRYEGFGSAHNLVMNEDTGFAYAVGSSQGVCNQGLQMIDVRDPRRPLFAGCFRDQRTRRGYTHDAQCVVYEGPDVAHRGREICLAANEDAVSIADVTDKSSPIALGVATYPTSGYVHQGWLTDDQRYFYQNDELDERAAATPTRTLIWDVQDLDDPQLAAEYFHDSPAIDHNLYVASGLVYEANYTSGLRILDIVDPTDPALVAHFDTTPDDDATGFGGAWSVYPYFSDGTIAVSSRSEGLFLLRAEGLVVSRVGIFSVDSASDPVQFHWSMIRQLDIARFDLERRLTDETFEVVESISAGVAGQEDYALTTSRLPAGRSEIRLVAVSESGARRILVEEDVFIVPGTHIVTTPYPNPAADVVKLSLLVSEIQQVTVEVFDASGRRTALTFQGWAEPDQELGLDLEVSDWPAGRYWVRFQGTSFSETRMIVVGH